MLELKNITMMISNNMQAKLEKPKPGESLELKPSESIKLKSGKPTVEGESIKPKLGRSPKKKCHIFKLIKPRLAKPLQNKAKPSKNALKKLTKRKFEQENVYSSIAICITKFNFEQAIIVKQNEPAKLIKPEQDKSELEKHKRGVFSFTFKTTFKKKKQLEELEKPELEQPKSGVFSFTVKKKTEPEQLKKRKPGRPRKKQPEELEKCELEQLEQFKSGQPQKKQPEDKSKLEKCKRGRSRKNKPEDKSKLEKRKSGRPPKNKPEEVEKPKLEQVEKRNPDRSSQLEKHKRRRPQKFEKGKRGRLRKNKASELKKSKRRLVFLAKRRQKRSLQKKLKRNNRLLKKSKKKLRRSQKNRFTQPSLYFKGKEIRILVRTKRLFSIENFFSNLNVINGALKEFFNSSELSQYMQQINPLAEVTHKRRVSSLGPGGVKKETAGMKIRGIHPSHYGRICPIETPEGKTAGIVNVLTTMSRRNFLGLLETPLYNVYKGQIQKFSGATYLSASHEQYSSIASSDLPTNCVYFLPDYNIPVRVGENVEKFQTSKVDYIGVSDRQMISVATCLIPFLEHNDANRALMGSNMQRQAIPVILPEKPIVGTGLESRIISDSGYTKQTKFSGFVYYVSSRNILVTSFFYKNSQSLKLSKLRFVKKNKKKHTKFSYICDLVDKKEPCLLNKNFKASDWSGFHNEKLSCNFFQKRISFIFKNSKEKKKLVNIEKKKKKLCFDFLEKKKYYHKIFYKKENWVFFNNSKFREIYGSKIHVFNLPVNKYLDIQYFGFFSIFKKSKNILNLKKAMLNLNKSLFLTKSILKIKTKTFAILLQNSKNFVIPFINTIKKVTFLQIFVKKQKLKQIFFFSAFKNQSFNFNFEKFYQLQISWIGKYGNAILANYCFKYTGENLQKYLSFDKVRLPNYCNAIWHKTKKKKKENFFFFKARKLTAFFFFFQKLIIKKKKSLKTMVFANILSLISPTKLEFVSKKKKKLEIRLGIETTYLYAVPKVFLFSQYFFSAFSSFLRRFFIKQFNIRCLRKRYYGKQLERRVPRVTKNLSFDLPKIGFFSFTKNHVLVRNNHVTQGYMFRIPENKAAKQEETVGMQIIPIAPYDILAYQGSNQHTSIYQTPLVYEDEWVAKGDVLTDTSASVGGELAVGKSILVAYMPWEGYNFEDAILINERLIYNDVYTSIHIENYKTYFGDTPIGPHVLTGKPLIPTYRQLKLIYNNGIVEVGSWVTPNDILVGKLKVSEYRVPTNYEVLVMQVQATKLHPPIGTKKKIDRNKKIRIYLDVSLRVPRYVFGRVVHTEIVFSDQPIMNFIAYPIAFHVHVYVAAKKTIEIGDKMSGRHGNKGIISNILPRQDMPYLPDGTPVDMVLNPLGVPSRMNVGQIFECLLGLAAKELNQHFRINCFDEVAGPEASRTLTYSKLFEARLKTGKQWLFNGNFPGKMNLFDGRTGESFHQTITVGQSYMLKLNHMVQDKIHARGLGPYATVTQQPLKGRKHQGGQRVGEMEVWALEGFGAAYTLQEILTAKSDDMNARNAVEKAAFTKTAIELGTPESFKLLISELQCLCVNVGIYSINAFGFRDRVDLMRISDQIFKRRETDNFKAKLKYQQSESYQQKQIKVVSR